MVDSDKIASSNKRRVADDDLTDKYRKRARHSTRHDLYEYKGGAAKESTRLIGRAQKPRVSIGTQGFRAVNVDCDRITLIPDIRAALLKRETSSFKIAGRDLPDLTFARMNFLSQPVAITRRDQYRSGLFEDRNMRSTRSQVTEGHLGPSCTTPPTRASSGRYLPRLDRSHTDQEQQDPNFYSKNAERPVTLYASREGTAWMTDRHDDRVEHYLPANLFESPSPLIPWHSPNHSPAHTAQLRTKYIDDSRKSKTSKTGYGDGNSNIVDEASTIDPTSSISNRIFRDFTDKPLCKRSHLYQSHSPGWSRRADLPSLELEDLKMMLNEQSSADIESKPQPITQITMDCLETRDSATNTATFAEVMYANVAHKGYALSDCSRKLPFTVSIPRSPHNHYSPKLPLVCQLPNKPCERGTAQQTKHDLDPTTPGHSICLPIMVNETEVWPSPAVQLEMLERKAEGRYSQQSILVENRSSALIIPQSPRFSTNPYVAQLDTFDRQLLSTVHTHDTNSNSASSVPKGDFSHVGSYKVHHHRPTESSGLATHSPASNIFGHSIGHSEDKEEETFNPFIQYRPLRY